MILELSAAIFLFGSAVLAILLARIDPRHRPLAIGISSISGAQIVRALLHIFVLHGGPYSGWTRVAFHAEEGLYLLSAAAVAWLAIEALAPWPPGPTRKVFAHGFLVLLALAWFALIACYPETRGETLRRVYLGAEILALLIASAAIISWIRRRGWRSGPDPLELARAWRDGQREAAENVTAPLWYTWSPVLMIVAADFFLLGVGAWPAGLFGAAYEIQDGGLIALWGTVAAVEGTAIALTRRKT